MKRTDCLEVMAELVSDQLVVTTMTGSNWVWRHLTAHDGTMNLSAMGNGTAVGAGMALGLPHRTVIVLESDGSTLMDLNTLPTLGLYRPSNLKVFVFDNEVYSGSAISQPTATASDADLASIARASGIVHAITVETVDAFRGEATDALREPGLRYVVAKVDEDPSERTLPKPTMDHQENKYHFGRYIERTEGMTIFDTVR